MSSYRFWLLPALCALLLPAAAQGATPKPWQWTTAQATTSLKAYPPNFSSEPFANLTAASCRGQGKAVARRFLTFRCVTKWEWREATVPQSENVVVWAKMRKAGKGQLCYGRSLASVPSACLALTGASRVLGKSYDAAIALRRWLATQFGGASLAQGMFECVDHGAGYFVCSFTSNRNGSATVTMTTKGAVVKLIEWTS